MEKGKKGRFTMQEIIIKFTRKKAMFTAQETLFFSLCEGKRYNKTRYRIFYYFKVYEIREDKEGG